VEPVNEIGKLSSKSVDFELINHRVFGDQKIVDIKALP
jgi:hypothetical protein